MLYNEFLAAVSCFQDLMSLCLHVIFILNFYIKEFMRVLNLPLLTMHEGVLSCRRLILIYQSALSKSYVDSSVLAYMCLYTFSDLRRAFFGTWTETKKCFVLRGVPAYTSMICL